MLNLHTVSANTPAVNEATQFAYRAWRELFGSRANPEAMPADLARFEATYCQGEGCFLLARAPSGEVVASIGYRRYDHRFAALDFTPWRTAEVVRLFVAPRLRRAGVASALVSQLLAQAKAAGVQALYLHTHPFLPGALAFWQRQGFELLLTEAEPVWQTTHMARYHW
ncbi:GNAT family N-acetyltransferase [Pseudomonas sp. NPDC007930]|uniref:GNAT family N-acetyltransferase n=1 Tax=Pseudomonas sp. NPDC007930 TaxID=3364417 RepID=UPI0036E94CAF